MGIFDYLGGDYGDGSGWGDWGSLGSDGLGGIFGGDSGGGGVFDYTGGDWGDGSGSFLDFGGSGDSSGGKGWGDILKGVMGGGSGSSIFGGLLSGLGAGAAAVLSGKDLKEGIKLRGEQDRLTLADQNKYAKEQIALQGLEGRHGVNFEASLKDYYTQEDKRRKRIALDTYGQFSTINKISPGYVDTPMPETLPKPTYT